MDGKYVRQTWAEINLDAIGHNVRVSKQILPPGTGVMAVVKANAYGHGASQVAEIALQNGAEYLGVAAADEAIELREAGITAPILILGYTPTNFAKDIVTYDLTQTVFNTDLLLALDRAAREQNTKAKIHLKVDTGMGRLGFTGLDEVVGFAKRAADMPGINLEGIFTHFATADELDSSYAEEQISRFAAVLERLQLAGLKIPLQHISNSAGIIQYTNCPGNMVRLGISMYGYYPSQEVPKDVELQPALRFVSHVVHLKEVPAGTKISYGATFETKAPSKIATIPVGYADGYSRLLSNKGEALIRGMRVPVVGRVCMDQLMLDVTEVEAVETGDEVVLYGRQGNSEIPLDEVADKIGTITYEVLCVLGRRVPRKFQHLGKTVEVQTM
ncbi:alanine racemase [Tumebacillus algifaecis]|uniref:Alanine racemase n=1 Tax=Tumebacillus algifaecis TaxID=1214604 RepID=A0A223D5H8_9BACL|nr:alanine racemase [Tumebacillus algifaecis]ASS76666.1 alanine racemase [Tumebacillus algifaecis]